MVSLVTVLVEEGVSVLLCRCVGCQAPQRGRMLAPVLRAESIVLVLTAEHQLEEGLRGLGAA